MLAAASLATALIGSAGGAGNGATDTQLGSPTAAVPTPDGGFLVTDYAKCVVNKVKSGTITRVAGDGNCANKDAGPVSCPSASFCAVGYGVRYGAGGIAFTTNPGAATPSWTITRDIRPSSEGTEGLSCAGPSLCVIAESSGKFYTSTNPAGGKATWHSQQVRGAWANNVQEAVSCPTTSLCVALADDLDKVLVSTNPGDATPTWTPKQIPDTSLWGVHCRSATLCVAYGNKTAGPSGGAAAVTTDPVIGTWHVGVL
ncbi:MAG: hypothetical protein QOG41_1350, partial [Thermoleophilaceae bacterium]|nr:hypothetical protein [Thermoleophilaceae bacterium]